MHALRLPGRLAARGVLPGSVCHEINNLLMIVQENAQTLLQTLSKLSTELDPEAFQRHVGVMQDMLKDARSAATKIKKQVADLCQASSEPHPILIRT